MSQVRYDYDLIVTIDDFNASNYLNILQVSLKDGYSGYWTALSEGARQEYENHNDRVSKVLWLLSDACSMMLVPENIQEPYSPMVVLDGKRSALPEDFSKEDIVFFESIVEDCKDFKLQARIADILWILKTKKIFTHLQLAINSYMQFSLEYDDILTDSREAFERLIRLAIITKQPLDDIKEILLEVYKNTSIENGFHCLWINDLLNIAQIDDSHYPEIIDKLESFAIEFSKQNNWYKSRDYHTATRSWYSKLGDEDNIFRLTKEIAETFVNEADGRKDSQMVAGKFLENAIQEYRAIPTKAREEFQVNQRIDEIYQKMTVSNQLALGEMQLMETDGIDISSLIDNTISTISNKELNEAIFILSNISSNFSLDDLRTSAEKRFSSFSLSSLFSSTHLASDGRVVAKTPGLDIGDTGTDAYKYSLELEIHKEYSFHIGLVTQANIVPAYQQLISEHNITKRYLLSLCANSSIVPRNRVRIWAEGLYFGFNRNFLVSIHLLIPQVENLIRILLKQIPVKTTVLDANGIEMEKGLSTLLDEEKLREVIDENLIFELKSLLANSFGFNLRNNIAHGLSDDATFHSSEALYFWRLCLHLVVNNSHLIEKGIEKNEYSKHK